MPLDVSGFEYAVGFMLATGVLHAVGISIGFLVGMATMLSGRWGVSLRSRTLPYVSEWLEEGKSARTAVHCEPMRCPPLRTDAMPATANRCDVRHCEPTSRPHQALSRHAQAPTNVRFWPYGIAHVLQLMTSPDAAGIVLDSLLEDAYQN